jgi:hypothetical protein
MFSNASERKESEEGLSACRQHFYVLNENPSAFGKIDYNFRTFIRIYDYEVFEFFFHRHFKKMLTRLQGTITKKDQVYADVT